MVTPTRTSRPPPPPSEAGAIVLRPSRALLVLSRFGVFRKPLVEGGRWLIGRGEDCDVRIDDSKASRPHCALGRGDPPQIVDLGSTNGTLLGDRRLAPDAPLPLRVGEPVTIGSTVMMVQGEG